MKKSPDRQITQIWIKCKNCKFIEMISFYEEINWKCPKCNFNMKVINLLDT